MKCVVLDTNILVSAIVYGGKPQYILNLVVEKKIQAVTSYILLAELLEALSKKFPLSTGDLDLVEIQIKQNFIITTPRSTLKVVRDDTDNKVLEAAIEGNCTYIITGDRDLLDLVSYKNIKILTASEFLQIVKE
ncbi:MAG: hypothetical protein UV61_C0022G0008 [Candidatus Gottesmanbacteria bacterium GW2011_GWB1_43_11]|uniref:PIN domain-containing protein n=1 Tax=Candidatus Gottesmanbacteria bacterium GW2011_GWB1_43_11 TaxID=1618446 RepID=A0A0G1FDS9_9BACT|nr:MAG: hypothetical protein UV04_C0021G0006 [Candidatus Gottesmanbacteria bacterium GW2011_GWA2_42_16]KKS54001.1 MAG: hypothetical protein UV17_C0028G0009 [Candidatus Gottesmanbacteria bacterium GW2011_GWA1_42_26]KKS80645.1 MAG: hypothetical protein UV55_C0034G0008 [Candidatus Gottesmanbacteria bacterium GW2011_GWC1_43_10]KKS85003.1 MAG: hypothetical protein UV61_C0022G0008 [Candidatus Gottesmanbacteria bacterium GW2011_GWB1_43_11]OGG09459.1 MAG: putative toxin-antitoxin system toxin component